MTEETVKRTRDEIIGLRNKRDRSMILIREHRQCVQLILDSTNSKEPIPDHPAIAELIGLLAFCALGELAISDAELNMLEEGVLG